MIITVTVNVTTTKKIAKTEYSGITITSLVLALHGIGLPAGSLNFAG